MLLNIGKIVSALWINMNHPWTNLGPVNSRTMKCRTSKLFRKVITTTCELQMPCQKGKIPDFLAQFQEGPGLAVSQKILEFSSTNTPGHLTFEQKMMNGLQTCPNLVTNFIFSSFHLTCSSESVRYVDTRTILVVMSTFQW